MRRRHRRGTVAGGMGRVAGRARIHLWLGWYWFRFVRATRGCGDGWRRTREGCEPRINWIDALGGLLPSRGGRRRACVRWRRDPLRVAMGEAPAAHDQVASTSTL
jgi:hypothetical protein